MPFDRIKRSRPLDSLCARALRDMRDYDHTRSGSWRRHSTWTRHLGRALHKTLRPIASIRARTMQFAQASITRLRPAVIGIRRQPHRQCHSARPDHGLRVSLGTFDVSKSTPHNGGLHEGPQGTSTRSRSSACSHDYTTVWLVVTDVLQGPRGATIYHKRLG